MAKYRKISPKIWNDAKFRSLSDNAKLVFVLLLTHPQTSAIGTLRAFPQGLAPEMGWSEKGFREPFQEVLEKGMAICSEKDGLIWMPNFTRHNPPDNPNVLKSWAGALDDCPECPLKTKVFQHVKVLAERLGKGFAKGFAEAFSEMLSNGMPNQEQEQEQDIKENSLRSFSCAEPSGEVSTPKPSEPLDTSTVSDGITMAHSSAAALPAILAPVITLPLNSGDEHPVTQGEIDQWQDLYPAVDVSQALRNMRGWLLANKTRRKTKAGIGRFIQGWLAKEQDRGGTARAAPQRATPARPGDFDPERQAMIFRDVLAHMEADDAATARQTAQAGGPVRPGTELRQGVSPAPGATLDAPARHI